MALIHLASDPYNYLYALEVERTKEVQIREIARKMNVDPELLLHPQGRRSFDFASLFSWVSQKLGFENNTASPSDQPENVREQIARVKNRYALVAADTTLAKLAQLIEVALSPENVRGKKKNEIKAELQSVLRLLDKDFLPALAEGLPGVAATRDGKMRSELNRLRRDVKAVINAPHALDPNNIDATLQRVREVIGDSLRLKGNGQPRWTRDPFPVKDSYRQAAKTSTGPTYGEGNSSAGGDSNLTSTPAVLSSAPPPVTTNLTAVSNAVASDVAALGQQLGTPAKAFAYVYDSIDWESYGGVVKGARGALHERKANDWDQALLLRDLLTAQGYQAQLEWGKVEIPVARAMNLVGTEDPLQAANLLATAGYDALALTQNGTPIAIRMTHAWVRAFIPYVPNRGTTAGTPDTWVRMDPSFKKYDYQSGIDVNVPWNEGQYLQTSQIRPPADYYADQIWAYIRANNLNCNNLAQVPKTGRIHAAGFPFVPATLNSRVVQMLGTNVQPPASMLQTITLSVVDPYWGDLLVSYSANLADLWGKKLSVTFAPATAEDAAIIARYGGLYNAPAYLVHLKAVVSVDDQPVAQGGSVAAGADLSMEVAFREPVLGTDFARHEITAGETMTEVFDGGRAPDSLIAERMARLQALAAQPPSDAQREAVLTEKLHLVGLRYFQEVDDGFDFATGTRWHRWVKSVFEGLVSQRVSVTYNFVGSAVRISPADRNIDVTRLAVGIIPIGNDQSERLNTMALTGLQTSYLEGSIWEEMEAQQGISATKALLLSRMAGQTIRTADRSNVEAVLAATNLSASVEANIRGAVAQGRIAIVPAANIRVNKWVGTGYILRDPVSGAATYPISGGFAGGSSTGGIAGYVADLLGSESWLANSFLGEFLAAVFVDEERPPSTTQSDPVNMSTGNMYRFANDLTIYAFGIPVGITRTYNSRSSYSGPFGYGWTYNYGEQIVPNGDGSVTYREPDGSEHRFTHANGVYTAPPGKHVQIANTGNGWTARLKNGELHTFDARGLLIALSNLNGNTVTINRDGNGNPVTVTDALGRTMLTFTVADGRIVEIADLTGRTVRYAYDGENLVSFTDALGKVWTMGYDLAHNMTSFADPLGNTQSYDYDIDDRLLRHTDANGAEESFHYDIPGRHSVVTEKRGGDRLIRYDDLGRATMEVDPAGNMVAATYDSANNRSSVVDSRGFTTTFEHDALGNPTKKTTADGAVTTTTYDSDSHILSMTTPAGLVTTNSYDSNGNLTRSERTGGDVVEVLTNTYDSNGQVLTTADGNGHGSSFTWSTAGALASRTDAAGATTTFTNDPLGRVTVTKDAAGNETRITFDARDRVLTQTDAYGITTTNVYDDAGRRISTTTPAGTSRFEYDREGRLLATVDALGNRTTMTYNAAGDVVARTDARGNTTRYEYDLSGRTTKIIDATGGVWTYGYCGAISSFCDITDPSGRTMRREFDVMGRVTKITDALSHSATMVYDLGGRKIRETDANGNVTRYTYDPAGRLLSVIDANGGVTSYTYDAAGNKLSQKDANGRTWTRRYDDANRLVEMKDPLGRTTTFTYDLLGNLITKTDAKGQTLRYSYTVSRPAGVTYPDTSSESIVYDALGRATSTANANVTYTYTYDSLGQVRSVRNERVGYLVSYEYDALGNRTKMTTPQSTATYIYDARNRLASIKDTLFGTFTFAYDSSDRRTELVYPNGIRSSYAYDETSRLKAIVSKDAAGIVVDAWSYQYDAAGNRISRTDFEGKSETYRYDALHQLVEATYANGTSEKLTYDPAGNRTSRIDHNGALTAYTYDAANQQITAGTDTFAYDPNGNQISRTSPRGTTTLTYDFNNLVTAITGPDGNESNKYDSAGRRMEMAGASIENGLVRPQYDLAGNPIADSDGSNGMWTYRLYGPGTDETLAEWRRTNNRITYHLHDALNSVTAVTTTSGTVAYRQSYTAFGAMTRTQDPSGIPPTRLGFTGRETSVGSLVQYRARYYDTSTGRFTSQDTGPAVASMPPSLNRYVYAINSPVNYNDPTGMAIPLIWSMYILLLAWTPVITLILLCMLAFALGYIAGVLIRQLFFDGPAMSSEEETFINVLLFLSTFGLSLLAATSPSFRMPGLREDVGSFARSSPYRYSGPYSCGGQCVDASNDFIKRYGGEAKHTPYPQVGHTYVEYQGNRYDPTIRDNIARYRGYVDDIPVNQKWFSVSRHDELLRRLPNVPGEPPPPGYVDPW